jgi:hypothetical protein
MMSIELTDEQVALLRDALTAFLSDFGHNEKDVVRQLQELLGKIPTKD